MTKLWTLTVLLAISLFFNVTQFSVIFSNEEYMNQQEYAIQHLGCVCNTTESKIAQGLCLEKLW